MPDEGKIPCKHCGWQLIPRGWDTCVGCVQFRDETFHALIGGVPVADWDDAMVEYAWALACNATQIRGNAMGITRPVKPMKGFQHAG